MKVYSARHVTQGERKKAALIVENLNALKAGERYHIGRTNFRILHKTTEWFTVLFSKSEDRTRVFVDVTGQHKALALDCCAAWRAEDGANMMLAAQILGEQHRQGAQA